MRACPGGAGSSADQRLKSRDQKVTWSGVVESRVLRAVQLEISTFVLCTGSAYLWLLLEVLKAISS